MQELGYVPLCRIILANTNNHTSDLNDLPINPVGSHRTVIIFLIHLNTVSDVDIPQRLELLQILEKMTWKKLVVAVLRHLPSFLLKFRRATGKVLFRIWTVLSHVLKSS
jgi:hypothetical protein